MLAEAGFENVRVEQLPHDIMNYYYIATPVSETPSMLAESVGHA
jgi:hypothetical protein